jgi:hypothetical protein
MLEKWNNGEKETFTTKENIDPIFHYSIIPNKIGL